VNNFIDVRNSGNKIARGAQFTRGFNEGSMQDKYLTWNKMGSLMRGQGLTLFEAKKVFEREWPLVAEQNKRMFNCEQPWIKPASKYVLTDEAKQCLDSRN